MTTTTDEPCYNQRHTVESFGDDSKFALIRSFFIPSDWGSMSDYRKEQALNMYQNYLLMCELMVDMCPPDPPDFVKEYNLRNGICSPKSESASISTLLRKPCQTSDFENKNTAFDSVRSSTLRRSLRLKKLVEFDQYAKVIGESRENSVDSGTYSENCQSGEGGFKNERKSEIFTIKKDSVSDKKCSYHIDNVWCPENLILKKSRLGEYGISVFARQHLEELEIWGPYSGLAVPSLVQDEVLRPQTLKNLKGRVEEISGLDNSELSPGELWTKFIRRGNDKKKQTVFPFLLEGNLYYMASTPISKGSELYIFAPGHSCQLENSGDTFDSSLDTASLTEKSSNAEENGIAENSPAEHNANYIILDAKGDPIERPHLSCVFCSEKFFSLPAMNRHVCRSANANESSVDKQVVSLVEEGKANSKPSKYPCSICKKSLQSPWKLKRHVQSHLGASASVCWGCGKFFADTAHMRAHQKESCKTLKWIFEAHRYQKFESLSSADEENVCGCPSLLHDRICTPPSMERTFTCDECGNAFSRSTTLKRHQKTVHHVTEWYVCPVCGKAYARRDQFDSHSCAGHGGKRTPAGPICRNLKPVEYKCDVCGLVLWTCKELIEHKKREHGRGVEFRCTLCDKVYKNSSGLSRHRRSVHSTRKKTFACVPCNLVTARKDAYTVHINSLNHRLICQGKRGADEQEEESS